MAFFGNADPYGSPYAGILGNPVYSQGILNNPTPTAPQPGFSPVPQPQQPQGNPFGGFLQNNSNSLMALGSALLGNPTPGMALASFGQQAPQSMATDRRRKALNNLLMSRSGKSKLDPDTIAYLNSDPELASKYIAQDMGLSGAGQYGMTPIWGTGADGKPVLMQMNSKGGMNAVQTPPGVTLNDRVNYLDTGTGYIPVAQHGGGTPASGAQPIAQDVAGKAAAQARGTTQGNVAAQLPQTLASGQRIIDGIDALLKDPGLDRITGPVGSHIPYWFNGDANRAKSQLDMVLGGTFLQAYNDLRGAGQISNAEGQSAKEAYNRLQRTDMNDADYKQALLEFRQELVKLLNIAQARAAGQLAPLSAQTEAIAPSAFGGQPAPSGADDGGWTDLGSGVRIRAVGQ